MSLPEHKVILKTQTLIRRGLGFLVTSCFILRFYPDVSHVLLYTSCLFSCLPVLHLLISSLCIKACVFLFLCWQSHFLCQCLLLVCLLCSSSCSLWLSGLFLVLYFSFGFFSWILFNLALFPAFVLLRLDSLDASFDNKAFVF